METIHVAVRMMPHFIQFWVVFSCIKTKELVPPICLIAKYLESHCHSAYKIHCFGVLQHFFMQHLSCFSQQQTADNARGSVEF